MKLNSKAAVALAIIIGLILGMLPGQLSMAEAANTISLQQVIVENKSQNIAVTISTSEVSPGTPLNIRLMNNNDQIASATGIVGMGGKATINIAIPPGTPVGYYQLVAEIGNQPSLIVGQTNFWFAPETQTAPSASYAINPINLSPATSGMVELNITGNNFSGFTGNYRTVIYGLPTSILNMLPQSDVPVEQSLLSYSVNGGAETAITQGHRLRNGNNLNGGVTVITNADGALISSQTNITLKGILPPGNYNLRVVVEKVETGQENKYIPVYASEELSFTVTSPETILSVLPRNGAVISSSQSQDVPVEIRTSGVGPGRTIELQLKNTDSTVAEATGLSSSSGITTINLPLPANIMPGTYIIEAKIDSIKASSNLKVLPQDKPNALFTLTWVPVESSGLNSGEYGVLRLSVALMQNIANDDRLRYAVYGIPPAVLNKLPGAANQLHSSPLLYPIDGVGTSSGGGNDHDGYASFTQSDRDPTNPGVLYFGPAGGLTKEQLFANNATSLETFFKAKLPAGNYPLQLGLVLVEGTQQQGYKYTPLVVSDTFMLRVNPRGQLTGVIPKPIFANKSTLSTTVFDPNPNLDQRVGVNHQTQFINLVFNNNNNNSLQLAAGRSLNDILVTANGVDERIKFSPVITGQDVLAFNLKPIYRLAQNKLYRITIPGGTFEGNPDSIEFSFVTTGVTETIHGLVTATSPKANDLQVRAEGTKQIRIDMVSPFTIDNNNNNNKIELVATKMTNNSTEVHQKADFNITTSGNSLLFTVRDNGDLKPYANYVVTLKPGAISLNNTADSVGGAITNQEEIKLTFTTGEMVASTVPANGAVGVSLQPQIRIIFKEEIEFVSPPGHLGKISLSSLSHSINLTDADIKIVPDSNGKNTILQIHVNDDGSGTRVLRANTVYTLNIEKETVMYTSDANNPGVRNRSISLSFTTTSSGANPQLTGAQVGADGNIHLTFDRQIQFDVEDQGRRLDRVELFQVPKGLGTAFDSQGRKYDTGYAFVVTNNRVEHLPNHERVGIPVDRVEMGATNNTIRIVPQFPLLPLNEYEVRVGSSLIQDIHGHKLRQNVVRNVWSPAITSNLQPRWLGFADLGQATVTNVGTEQLPNYQVVNAPRYSEANPITLLVDGEIVPRSLSGLMGINLVEQFRDQENIGFVRFEVQYIFSQGQKQTKILLYPAQELGAGKTYQLTIPGDVWRARNNRSLPGATAQLVIVDDKSAPKGILSLLNNSVAVTSLMTGDWIFTIRGFNFHESIEKIELVPIAGPAQGLQRIEIRPENIYFRSSTEIQARITGANRAELAREARVGDYRVYIYFNQDNQDYKVIQSPAGVNLSIASKGKPAVKAFLPADGATGINERTLLPRTIDGVTRYFLRVTFADIDGSLRFNQTMGTSILKSSSFVRSEGGSQLSMVDVDFLNFIDSLEDSKRKEYIDQHIFTKNTSAGEAYLFIPVRLLRNNTRYLVHIGSGVVLNDIPGDGGRSDAIAWSFSTMPEPFLEGINPASVAAGYDESQPIIIAGDNFYTGAITVLFNSRQAHNTIIREDSSGRKFLEVYLPRGSNRLQPGTYDVTVRNSANHERIYYGAFSVIPSGGSTPPGQEGSRIKNEAPEGTVIETTLISEDTLVLNSRHSNRNSLSLNLDTLMGEDVLTRLIKYTARNGGRIGTLETRSKWADITLHNLTATTDRRGEEVVISLGRVQPTVGQSLARNIRGGTARSELIEVKATNATIGSIRLDIPFRNSDGSNLKVMRYDERLRSWYDVPSAVDRINQTVRVVSNQPGIFLVVE